MTAIYPLHCFFPLKPKPGSPLSGVERDKIMLKLKQLLMSEPNTFEGYTLLRGNGMWYSNKAWHSDRTAIIMLNIRPGTVQQLVQPFSDLALPNPARQYVARIAYLSCVLMGHDTFYVTRSQNSEMEFDKSGMTTPLKITFEELLRE